MSGDLERCYRILELAPGASLDDVKEAYRTLAKVWHPDRFVDDPAMALKAGEKLKQINISYSQICETRRFGQATISSLRAIKTPTFGESISSGILTKWHVTDGQVVTCGQLLFELETDKIILGVEAEVSGQISLKAVVGTEVTTGEIVAMIDETVRPVTKHTN